MAQFPSEASMQRLKQTSNVDWSVGTFGGLPYLYRVVQENEGKTKEQATLRCKADFRLTIMKTEGNVVVVEPTDYSVEIKGSILPIVQALLLNMQEGDRVEAIAPAALAYGDEADVYVEIELKTIHHYTGVKFIYHKEEQV